MGGMKPAAGIPKRTMGEPAMLNDYNKPPLDWIDLDDVQVQGVSFLQVLSAFGEGGTDKSDSQKVLEFWFRWNIVPASWR